MIVYLACPMTTATPNSSVARGAILDMFSFKFPNVRVIDPFSYGLIAEDSWAQIVYRAKADIRSSSLVILDFITPSSGVAMCALYASYYSRYTVGLVGAKNPSPWVIETCEDLARDLNELENLLIGAIKAFEKLDE